MLKSLLLWLDSNGWIVVLAFYIIYIIVKIIISIVKNKKVDVDMLYRTLKKIPQIMTQAELLFPSGTGADKLAYCTDVIKLIISENNPNSVLLSYNWDSLIQDIFDCTTKINAKGGK